jgi:ribosomal protein S18 acetylase RimI-like enzyme
MVRDGALLARIESCYDRIVRGQASTERYGGLELFIREGPGWPLYARPARGVPDVGPHDIAAVRARQRALGVPESFEWLHDLVPGLLTAAEQAGLAVLRAPLLVLDPAALAAPTLSRAAVRLLDPAARSFPADLAASRAVAAVGFGNPGTGVGEAGPAERDAATVPLEPGELRRELDRTATGDLTTAVAETDKGPVASGALLRAGDTAEIAGVATLPAVRRRGLGAAVTVALSRHALRSGVTVVFLSAGSDEIARVYQRVGFRRVGTACIAGPAFDPVSPL